MLLRKNTDYELQLTELNEKLLKSETERNILKAKFQHLHETYKNEEHQKIASLQAKYNKFLEDSIERNQRNEKILKSLQKVENGANAVFAKTERLKQLRSHYDAYLSRAMPLWRHPDVLGDTGVSTTWIREPRTTPVTVAVPAYPHPAMLLPGGGAVMLPIHSNPAQAHQVDISKRVPSSNEKVIASLGKAGEIMMQELGIPKGNSLNSIYQPLSLPSFPSTINTSLLYQPFQLPIYIPPAATYFANSTLSTSLQPSSLPTSRVYNDLPKSYENLQAPNATGRKSNYSLRNDKNELSSEEPLKMQDYKPETYRSGLLRSECRSQSNILERNKAPRENYEIECLQTESNNCEDDLNLSDDDVLDKVISKAQNVAKSVSINGNEGGRTKKSDKLKQFKLAFETVRSLSKTENPVNYSPLERNHFAKKVEVAHQKSIDDLKSMLSVEDDQSFADTYTLVPGGNDGHLVGDEDVPDDFNEQNFPENHYDQRYQNDISRNVILEEDEEEEELLPTPNRQELWHNDKYDHQNTLENYPVGIPSTNGSSMNEYYGNSNVQDSRLIITPPSMEQVIPKNKSQDENKPLRTRSATGGRRSPSPTLKKSSLEKRGGEVFSKMSDNQRLGGEVDNNFGMADNIEKVFTSKNDSSAVNANHNFSHQQQSYNREFNELQAEKSNVGNYESRYYPSDNYYSSDNAQISDYPQHEMLEHAAHQESRTAAQSAEFVESEFFDGLNQDQNVSQNNYLITPEEYTGQNRYDEEDYRTETEGLPAQQQIDYSDEQSFRDEHSHHIEHSQGQGNESSNLQYNLDNRQYYEPAQGQSGEPYYPPPYENNKYYEPSQNVNESFVENYVAHSEEYQQIPSEARIYHKEPWEVSNEPEIIGQNVLIENQQQSIEVTDKQLPIQGGLFVDKPIAPSNIDEEYPQIPPSKSISPVSPDSSQNQQLEEKLKPSPQKQTPQRTLQRRQSLLTQQSPQRQKQVQKSAQQKKQSSPKKPQSSPKKPSTPPEPQPKPPPSVMTQLIDSESESYQVEPSSQNQDDSDFDFSIGK